MTDDEYCFPHSPATAEAALEASRTGGKRRRRELSLQHIYEFDGFAGVEGSRRLLDIAAVEALALPNSVGRVRALTYIVWVSLRMYEDHVLNRQLQELRALVEGRRMEIDS